MKPKKYLRNVSTVMLPNLFSGGEFGAGGWDAHRRSPGEKGAFHHGRNADDGTDQAHRVVQLILP